jgi:hypothetical protein
VNRECLFVLVLAIEFAIFEDEDENEEDLSHLEIGICPPPI